MPALTRPRVALAVATAALTVGGFGLAWANVSSPDSPARSAELAASQSPDDVSGNCDEAEHASDPECAVGTASPTSSAVPTSDPSPDPSPASPAPAPAGRDVRTFDAAGAGVVSYRVDGSTLTLLSAPPAAGWVTEVEQASGIELDLDFRSGTRRVQVDVEFEDGGVRERVRFRDDADDSRTETVNGTTTRVEPGDDQDGDDERSGHGGGDDDPEERDDDDRSGHGGDDEDDD